MRWTKKRPTKSGWYWYKNGGIFDKGIVKVAFMPPVHPDKLCCIFGSYSPLESSCYDTMIWSKEAIKGPKDFDSLPSA